MPFKEARFSFEEIKSGDENPEAESVRPLSAKELAELQALGGANAFNREENLAIYSPAMDVINILELSARERKEVIGEVHAYKVRKKEKVETIDMKVKPMLADIVKALKKERELITNEVMLVDIKQQKLREIKELLDLIREKRPDFVRGLRHAEEVLKIIFTPPMLAQLKRIIETRYNSLHRDETKYNDLSGRSLSNAQ